MGEEFQVEAGSSHANWEFAPGGNVFQNRKCNPAVESRVKGVRGFGDAIEMMRNQILLFIAGGSGDGLDSTVELEGVGINDFPIERPCQGEGMGGLPGSRWSAQVKRVWRSFQNQDFLFSWSGDRSLRLERVRGMKIPVNRGSRGWKQGEKIY